MVLDISEKLRNEINESKKKRHDFAFHKFTIITAFLGVGSLNEQIFQCADVEILWLLYLVPIVAIAFDIYILSEEYRIVRAGTFLLTSPCVTAKGEKEWERFVGKRPNILSQIAFALVTLIYLCGAAGLIRQSDIYDYNCIFFWIWAGMVIVIEVSLVMFGILFRRWIKKAAYKEKNRLMKKKQPVSL